MQQTIIVTILLIILIVSIYYIFIKISKSEAVYVKSQLNNKEYLVQNLEDKDEASYMLSIIHQRIFLLKDHLQKNIKNYPDYEPYIKQFCDRIVDLTLIENPPDGKYTSFTVNKGEEIALCLRSVKSKQLHDLNLIMYVVIHELAHVACPETDHTPLFKKIFIFLLKVSITIKIYNPDNYQDHPQSYCGIVINENLLKY